MKAIPVMMSCTGIPFCGKADIYSPLQQMTIHNEGTFPDALGWIYHGKISGQLSHEALVQNLLCGNFYASSGPQIFDWGIREGVAYVDCSPVAVSIL